MSALPQRDERGMVEAAQRGDHQAQAALYQEALPRLRRAAMYFLGRNDPEIDDIVQETWIIANAKLREFEFRASVFTWLNHICVNLCYKRVRKLGREIAKDQEDLDLLTRRAAKECFDAREEKEVKEGQRRVLRRVMEGMGSSCRETIQWRDFDGLSYGEMSDRTGLTVGAVHARVSRCRKRLKDAVRDFLENRRDP